MGKTPESANTTPPRKPRVVDDKGGLYELGKRIAEGEAAEAEHFALTLSR